jgi:HD superfamily phosphodiesterase
MTTKEKIKAIIERVPMLDNTDTSHQISVMVILGYLNTLSELGLIINTSHDVTPVGKSVIAICEEFDWKPSDADIEMFINSLVKEDDRPAIGHFLRQYRDNRDELLEKIKKFRDTFNEGE